jgi:fatty acid desaturase
VLWFNNGYHQEHHWDPKNHWTRMHELHDQIKHQLARHGTRILKGPHLTALLEDWWIGRKPLQKANKAPQQKRAA